MKYLFKLYVCTVYNGRSGISTIINRQLRMAVSCDYFANFYDIPTKFSETKKGFSFPQLPQLAGHLM